VEKLNELLPLSSHVSADCEAAVDALETLLVSEDSSPLAGSDPVSSFVLNSWGEVESVLNSSLVVKTTFGGGVRNKSAVLHMLVSQQQKVMVGDQSSARLEQWGNAGHCSVSDGMH
jgi:hypothetical protein